jgi:CheY-like chemotaxis protein
MRVLMIEDSPADIHQATTVLQRMGIDDIHAITSVPFAMEYLRDVTDGRDAPPDVVILDLLFGKDSGFEVLRFWKSTPKLKDVRIIVWTISGELEQKMCKLFGVEVVPKWSGPGELQRVLEVQPDSTTA